MRFPAAWAILAGVLVSVCATLPQTAPKSVQKTPAVLVDINHASLGELLTVPGMTRSWAGRIIRFRPYRSKQDLLDHGVLPSEAYDRIKDFIIAHRQPQ